MKQLFEKYFLLFITISLIIALTAFIIYTRRQESTPLDSLSRILKSGKIRVITQNNANCYYIYRGEPMGFEYELAREFAAFLEVNLEIITPSWSDIFYTLDTKQGDFIAAGVTITDKRAQKMLFCQPYMTVQQMFIYHKSKLPIESIEELPGRTIHISDSTSYHERLLEIKESGIDIDMVVHDDLDPEDLLRMISEKEVAPSSKSSSSDKEISYTIADSNIALLNRRYYPDIRIGIPIHEKEYIGWAVKPDDIELSDKMVVFFDIIKSNGVYDKIYKKYYGNVDEFDYFDLLKFHERLETRLPRYKKVIMKECEKYGFDWRMIAAMIYQESHFDPKARSKTGVRGLMQITEETASDMGISNRRDPVQSMKAGIAYLKQLYHKFNGVNDTLDRIKFAMASYNIGYAHVLDAQRLARRQGLDANKWSSIKKTLPLLAKKKYYTKVKYGYARGGEPVKYIERIFMYYDILKQKAHSGG
ncbi:Membrane-bound lytic murein transglycosylase F [Desulfamplus magnetovallimortis]|uniref:Membrane-bound lytic murein transglycosylase F n=1 Tax=Desulfamplus magnetovallimortis TaxID=1246637 RepID=A0A1W1HIB3_9BACT|nr:membrane-bound lytic murein transglycosylase MltF [Desulfamplus magnetovallimortis]SLM32122.1 Membrane-bound lytic murein transglycosylase F [Desulfamplus magnetovallimortis]